jgi:hypothetical protein
MDLKSGSSENMSSVVPAVISTQPLNLPKPLGNVPYSKPEQRNKLFRDAGITKKALAGLTKKAFDRIDQALDASKKTYSSFNGHITDERSDPDHGIRTKAAQQALELTDALPSKQEGLLPSKVTVEVKLPEWFRPKKAIEVKVAPVSE